MTLPGRVAFVDLETTGTDAREDRVTEIGLVLVDDGHLVEEWSSLLNPGREIPPTIETLTGITNEMVTRAPAFADVSLDLAARLHGRLLVAHNARFDYAFLRHEFRRVDIAFEAPVLCTVGLCRALFPEHQHHNLDSVMERLGLACEARHRALPDARVLVDLTRAIARCVHPPRLAAACRDLTLTPHLPAGVHSPHLQHVPDTPGVYLLHAPDGTPLFAGRATNLRTQVLALFRQPGAKARELRAALQAGSLEWFPTAGTVGTALRHLRLVESLAPRYNRPPRLANEAWAMQVDLQSGTLGLVDLQAEEAAGSDLFGPFRSRQDALAALRGLSREHRLCPQRLGLEPGSGPCSGYGAKHCRGVCAGAESPAAHTLRVAQALWRLRLPAWPFDGPVAIAEEDPERTRLDLHVAFRWRYLGSARAPCEAYELVDGVGRLPPFDVDVFRILTRTLTAARSTQIKPLPMPRAAA